MTCLPIAAHAQVEPTPPSGPTVATGAQSDKLTDIVVTGQKPAAQSSIDRKTYKIANDLQSGSGSASDVLRNLPSVDVDAQGAISLRGDTNVTILIDGKPSTTMTSANRADALEQLPANTIDHVEVITNPSAQFKPDGSAGIINIVTKQNRRAGLSGSVSASAGSDGRFNLAGNVTYRAGPLAATASATLHRDVRRRPFTDRRTEVDPITGVATSSTQDSLFHGEKLSRIIAASVDYDLSASDRVSASGTYTLRTGTPQTDQRNLTSDAGGNVTSDFDRTGIGHEHEVSDEASVKYRHNFAQNGQFLTLDLRRGETIENEIRRFTDSFRVPALMATIDQQRPRLDILQRELTAEYTQPLWGGKLLAGYDLQRDDDDFLNRGELIDPVTGAASIDPSHTNHFAYSQTVHAFYATYEAPIAKHLSAVLGLRLEQADITTHQIDFAVRGQQSYFRAYPTLHLQYAVADGQSLKFSYSKRIVRPDPEDLNPAPVFSDPLNQRAGNPNLKPQETQAFEAGYQYEVHGLSLEATLFLRKTRNGFTDVSRFITPTILLSTKENLGRSTAFGLDFSGNGKLVRGVSYRLSGTLSRNEIDASNLGFAAKRALVGVTAKAGLDYKITRFDLVQVSANLNGRRLTPQGYRLASVTANIGYRHKFRSGLSAVVSVSDLFDSQRERSVIDIPTLIETSTRRNTRRILSLALSWPLGVSRSNIDAPMDFSE